MAKQCVYCESSQNLNTSLTIKLEDGSQVVVDICDEHAEEATFKSAREAYMAKQDKIKEVMAMAEKLGLTISESSGGIATIQAPSAPAQPKQSTPPSAAAEELDPTSPDVIPTSRVDRASAKGMQSVGGSTEFGAVESHQHVNASGLQDQLPEEALDGMAEMAVVEGREGQPLAIQKKRVDGTGTTVITINKGENDQRLQSRFKHMADDSMEGKTPDFARQGYANTTATCSMCRGECSIKHGGKIIPCPKCNGSGIISTY
jgi:hypothetical protein